MTYPNLKFLQISNRPFFYTNFVSTIDGKVQVTKNSSAYWPIGSPTDYQTLIELRTHADVLIHGKNTALSHRTVDSLGKKEFIDARRNNGKENELLYVVLSKHPNEQLTQHLKHSSVSKIMVTDLSIPELSHKLHTEGYKNVLVEGGPHVLSEFLKHDVIDDVFLTIAPKIFGNETDATLTMSEGYLFPPEEVKNFKVISVQQIGNDVYLRYRRLSLPDMV